MMFSFLFFLASCHDMSSILGCLSARGNCNNLRPCHTKMIVGVVTDEEIRGFELGFEAPILCRYPQY